MIRATRPKLERPVSCPGKLGFWTLPDDVEHAVTSQLVRTS
jgi:hypothetical protein